MLYSAVSSFFALSRSSQFNQMLFLIFRHEQHDAFSIFLLGSLDNEPKAMSNSCAISLTVAQHDTRLLMLTVVHHHHLRLITGLSWTVDANTLMFNGTDRKIAEHTRMRLQNKQLVNCEVMFKTVPTAVRCDDPTVLKLFDQTSYKFYYFDHKNLL